MTEVRQQAGLLQTPLDDREGTVARDRQGKAAGQVPDELGRSGHGHRVIGDALHEVGEQRIGELRCQVGLVGLLGHHAAAVEVVDSLGTFGEPRRRPQTEVPEGQAPGILPMLFGVHESAVAVEDDGFGGPAVKGLLCDGHRWTTPEGSAIRHDAGPRTVGGRHFACVCEAPHTALCDLQSGAEQKSAHRPSRRSGVTETLFTLAQATQSPAWPLDIHPINPLGESRGAIGNTMISLTNCIHRRPR
ncbi:protein of unknown function [Streptomyces sp. KY75]|nr:protein of unknown function [Streptomyces sp. KY75]CAD5983239.1 protein of unknown function [Streptomyces sp. KY70]